MKGISIRLFLTPNVLAKLVTAIAIQKFRRFVRPPTTKPAGEFHQVDIRILESYDVQEPKAGEEIHPTEKVIVTREMVGELFDFLGIFPRSEKQELPEWVLREVRFFRSQILTARSELIRRVDNLPELYGHVNNVFGRITSSCEKIEQLLSAK